MTRALPLFRPGLLAAAISLASVCTPALADTYQLPAAPLASTLTQIASQAGIVLSIDPALTVGKLGFAYTDGVDSTEVPQDDDYFFGTATLTLQTAGTYRKVTSTAPVRLPKDANLVLISSGAAHASEGVADFRITGVLGGPN